MALNIVGVAVGKKLATEQKLKNHTIPEQAGIVPSLAMISSLSPVPSIPEPFGPHKVGTTEWEIPVSEIPSSSPVPDPQISTIKFRMFYPTVATASSKVSVPWLPNPQRDWSAAYASFLGASPKLASCFSRFPFFLNYTSLPAIADAPLLPLESNQSTKYPVVVFSHGLGGNSNTYSAVCTSLASFGVVCVAPEHRDGSAPVAFIRSADGTTARSIGYQRHPHVPTREVLTPRNAQLRIRIWELEQLFTVLSALNSGDKQFSNYAVAGVDTASGDTQSPGSELLSWTDILDLGPGRITWAGHSFGACTMVQFVKSVYYHQSVPSLKGTPHENDLDWQPLYKPASNSDLLRQITPDSPLALLDLWSMPLSAEQTSWLLEKPLPYYDRDVDSKPTTPTVVAITTAEFYRHAELLRRMRSILSADPVETLRILEARDNSITDPRREREELAETTALSVGSLKASDSTDVDVDARFEASPDTSSAPSRGSSPTPGPSDNPSPASSRTSVSDSGAMESGSNISRSTHPSAPKLFLIPDSAHLSQSDFGLLFPRLVRYLTKAENPEEIIALNVRAVLSIMRGAGLKVEPYKSAKNQNDAAGEEDDILTVRCKEKRFVSVPLLD